MPLFPRPTMKLGITSKLFLAVLVSCAIVLLINNFASRISFQRGFLGYLNEQGESRMLSVIPRIAQAYQAHGSWDFLRTDNLQPWFEFMRPDPLPDQPRLAPPVSDQTGAILRPVNVNGDSVGWMALVPFQQEVSAGDVRFYESIYGVGYRFES